MMKTVLKLITVLAILFASLSQTVSVLAAEPIQYRGTGADTYFSHSEGCINTDVFVQGLDFQYKKPASEPQSYAFITVSQYNTCTGEGILYVEGLTWLSESDFQVSQNQDSATLTAMVTGFDEVSESTVDVYIDLTWTASGPATPTNNSYHYKYPGCHINEKFTQLTRTGTASGTVSIEGLNLTPEASWSASVWGFRNGSVDIGCE